MATVADLGIKLSADYADMEATFGRLRSDLTQIERETGGAAKAVSEHTAAIGSNWKLVAGAVGASALAIGKGLLDLTQSVAESAEAIGILADKTGVSAAALESWQPILNRTGLSVQAFSTSYAALSKDIVAAQNGQQAAIEKFAAMGLAVSDLGDTQQVFAAVADRIASIVDPAQRAQLAVDLFGRGGLALIPALKDGAAGLRASAAEAAQWGLVIDRDARAKLLAFDDALDDLNTQWVGLKTQIAANAVPALLALVQSVQAAIDGFRSLSPATKEIAGVLAATFAAGGPLVAAAAGAAAAFGVALAPIMVGGAVVLGLIASATLLLRNWESLRDGAASAMASLGAKLRGVWEELKGTAIVQWTGLKVGVLGAVDALVGGVQVSVAKLLSILDGIKAKTDAVKGFFRDLYIAVVGQSYIPDMVEEIDRHMQNLDVSMTAPARNAVVNTARVIEGGALSWQATINQAVSALNFGWGSLAQTVGASLAQMTVQTVDWGRAMTQVGVQILGQMITTFIQIGAQAALTFLGISAQQTAAVGAHSAMETAKTAATSTNEAARLAISAATNKAMLASTIATLGSIGAVGTAAIGVLGAVVAATAGALAAIGAALVATVVGAPLGAAFLGASAAVLSAGAAAVATAAGAIQAAIGGAIAVASTALAVPAFAEGGVVFGPTLALVGEAGPEVIAPLSALSAFGDDGDHITNIYLDGEVLARHVDRRIRRRAAMEGAFQ